MITFRPFLIIYYSLKSTDTPDPFLPFQPFPSSPSLHVWLLEACQCAVDPAQRLIHFLAETLDQHELARLGCFLDHFSTLTYLIGLKLYFSIH